MGFINFNGELFKENDPAIPSWNRSFLYGDGLFETIRMMNGKLLFLSDHFNRLVHGAEILKISLPENFSLDLLRSMMQALAAKNGVGEHARIRFTLFRDGMGKYLPDLSASGYLVTAESLEPSKYFLNSQGLKLGLFTQAKKSMNIISNLKTCNALLYVLAAMEAKENSWDDCLILNSENRIAEATASNIFVVHKGIIYTPALSEGPVAGIMRKQILHVFNDGFDIRESEITGDMLMEADEIFLTNSITGIRWVVSYNQKKYSCKMTSMLHERLNKRVGAI